MTAGAIRHAAEKPAFEDMIAGGGKQQGPAVMPATQADAEVNWMDSIPARF